MTTIPSIDLMNPVPAPSLGALATSALENGAAFADAVSLFQKAMTTVPEPTTNVPGSATDAPEPATDPTAAPASQLPAATPESFARTLVANETLAAALPAPKPLTLPEVIAANETLAATLPAPKPIVAETLVRTPEAASVAPEAAPATPETLKAVVEETLARMPETAPATPETLKAVVEETLARMPEAAPATPETLKAVVEETLARMPKAAPADAAKPAATKSVDGPKPAEEKTVVLQAAPTVAPAVVAEATPVSRTEASVAPVEAPRVGRVTAASGSEVLLAAADAVVETMMVSPGLMRGEGEIRVMLKPDVLEGTELSIRIGGGRMSVEFLPTVERVAQLLVENQPQLVQHLTERIHSFQIAVNVNPRRTGGKNRV